MAVKQLCGLSLPFIQEPGWSWPVAIALCAGLTQTFSQHTVVQKDMP